MNKIKIYLSLFLLCSFAVGSYAQIKEKLQFEWEEVASLSDEKGVNGIFSGVHNDVLIIAGGSNFPETPVWEGGSKEWYNNIQVLEKQNGEFKWIDTPDARLPHPMAYGASVSLPQGVLLMGGNNADQTFSDVYLLQWDPVTQEVTLTQQASLPVPLANMQATTIGNKVYLVGGQQEEGGISKSHLFSFQLGGTWEKLPDLPGKGRIQPVVIAQSNGRADVLYVLSGTHFNPEAADPNEFLGDVYEFNPRTSSWTQKASIPSNNTPGMESGYIGAAPSLKLGDAHIIIFGGAGGENQLWTQRLSLQKEMESLENGDFSEAQLTAKRDSIGALIKETFQQTSFSQTIWSYHTITDTWTQRGSIPGQTQVVTNAVEWGDDIIIAAGETSPGLRTSQVNKVTIVPHQVSFGWVNYTTLFLYLAIIMGIGMYF